MDFLDLERIRRQLATHQQTKEVRETIDAFTLRFGRAAASAQSWRDAVDAYEAADTVTLMTVHKSKGLEFHTVFFLGLDDRQWWSHARNPKESTAAFYVGLSRAAQRTVFTWCRQRGDRTEIANLYTLLTQAGVNEIHFG